MNKNEDSTKGLAATMTSLFIFCILGITLALIISLLGSALLLFELLPLDYLMYFSLFSVFVGSFFASILACKKLGKPLITSLSTSALFLTLLYITGALLYGRFTPESPFLSTVAASFSSSLLGAFLSASRGRKRKPKLKH